MTPDTPPQRQKAVALKQDRDRTDIPRITASGHGKNAERILKIAFDNNVKVRTDENLVEILSAFDVDSYIPLNALQPVSEILSYLYQENIRLSAAKYNPIIPAQGQIIPAEGPIIPSQGPIIPSQGQIIPSQAKENQ